MEDIMSTLKVLADKRMEISVIRMQDNDSEYKKELNKVIDLEKQYESMNLENEARQFLNKLLRARDAMNMEQMSLAYLAGLEDAVLILRQLELLQL